MKILVIEDNLELLAPISMTFKLRWPDSNVVHTASGIQGVELAETESPDIIILDIGLPDITGFEVLRQIRLFSDVPVLILSVQADEIDRVRGLEAGADDYITKPFSALEFLARVNSALRRGGREEGEKESLPFTSGDLTIDFAAKEVFLKNKPLHLTSTEYQILYQLVRNEGKFLDHGTLEQRVWGKRGAVDDSVIRRYVYQLRKKLDDIPPKMLLNEMGKGYKFNRITPRTSQYKQPGA